MVSVRVKVKMYTTRATAATASTRKTTPNTEHTMITTEVGGEGGRKEGVSGVFAHVAVAGVEICTLVQLSTYPISLWSVLLVLGTLLWEATQEPVGCTVIACQRYSTLIPNVTSGL